MYLLLLTYFNLSYFLVSRISIKVSSNNKISSNLKENDINNKSSHYWLVSDCFFIIFYYIFNLNLIFNSVFRCECFFYQFYLEFDISFCCRYLNSKRSQSTFLFCLVLSLVKILYEYLKSMFSWYFEHIQINVCCTKDVCD